MATWPLAPRLTSKVPLGTEGEATVPVFSIWNLWWTADRIPHGFGGFLDAPFFHPNEGVTTYSEPMPLVGTLVSPLWAAGAPPALVYNVALLALLTLNGVFAYRLARALELPAGPALVGGVVAVTVPFTAGVLGVLPSLGLFGMLWTLDGLVRFGRTGWGGWAAWAAAGFAATYFTFQQYALFFAPVALAAAIVALSERRFARPALARLGVAALLAVLAVLILALPTSSRHADTGGFERPPELVEALSASPGDFLTRPATASVPVPRHDPADTAGLFPGFLLAGLAVAGAAAGMREGRRRRRWPALLTGMAAFGFLLALGLNLDLLGWRPFGTLRAHVSAFAEVRSPYRAAAIMQVCLPVLAALALARLRGRLVRGGVLAMVVLGLVTAAENLAVPASLHAVPRAGSAWSAWLREHPEHRVLAHVPFPAGLTVAAYEVEAWRLLAQTDHRRAMVNGYSGFFPVTRAPDGRILPAYTDFQLRMAAEFPTGALMCTLTESLGVDTLVADRNWVAGHERELARFESFLLPVYADADVRIYSLATPPGRCEVS